MDKLSEEHFRTVRAEITGRFFSADEAHALKELIDTYTVTDPHIRAQAARVWSESNAADPR